MAAGRAKAARAARRLAQFFDLVELGQCYRGRHQLGDALATTDRERLVAMVDHDDLQFAAIVAVDRAGRIGDADAMLERKTRAGPDLNFIALWDGDLEAGGDGVTLTGLKVKVFRRDHVHPSRAMGGVAGQGKPFAMGKAGNSNRN